MCIRDRCKAVTDPSKDRYCFALPLGDLHAWKTILSFLQANYVDLLNVDENGDWYIDLDDESRAAMVETYDYLYKLVKDWGTRAERFGYRRFRNRSGGDRCRRPVPGTIGCG